MKEGSRCHSENCVKNGSIHNAQQKYQCKDCCRQFVENPQNKPISEETKELIDKLLLERISLADGVSKRWLQQYLNAKYENISQKWMLSINLKAH